MLVHNRLLSNRGKHEEMFWRPWRRRSFLHLVCIQHVIFTKDYTEVFYTIYQENLPSIQCQTNLETALRRWETKMAWAFSFIDFYVPVLTPRFHWSEDTAFWEKNLLCDVAYTHALSVKRARRTLWGLWGRVSSIYKLYRVGARTPLPVFPEAWAFRVQP
jgi:hypothetical protein